MNLRKGLNSLFPFRIIFMSFNEGIVPKGGNMNAIMMIFMSLMALAIIMIAIVVLIDLHIKSEFLKGDWYFEMLDKTVEYYFERVPEMMAKLSSMFNDDDKPDDKEEA